MLICIRKSGGETLPTAKWDNSPDLRALSFGVVDLPGTVRFQRREHHCIFAEVDLNYIYCSNYCL